MGPYGSSRPLLLASIRDYGRVQANPFSAPSGGQAGYNDLEGWAEFTMRDWTAGAGIQDPESGGFQFAVAETRIRNRFMLPPRMKIIDSAANSATIWADNEEPTGIAVNNVTEGVQVVSASPVVQVAVRVKSDANGYLGNVYVLALIPEGVTMSSSIRINDGGTPHATPVDGDSILGTNTTKMPRWELVLNQVTGLTANTDYWMVLSADGTCYVGTAAAYEDVQYCVYTVATSWVEDDTKSLMIAGKSAVGETPGGTPVFVDGDIYLLYDAGTSKVWKYDAVNENFDTVALTGAWQGVPKNAAYFFANGLVYAAQGGTTDADTFDPLTGTIVDANIFASGFVTLRGYLYKWYNEATGNTHQVSYTGDGAIWTDVDMPSTVHAVAEMNGDPYAICADGLYRIGPGDFVEGIVRWEDPILDSKAIKMKSFQGSLIILVNGRLFRLDSSHTMMGLRPGSGNLGIEFSDLYFMDIATSNTYLYITMASNGSQYLISWSPDAWHILAVAHIAGDGSGTEALQQTEGGILFTNDCVLWRYVTDWWKVWRPDYDGDPSLIGDFDFHPFGWLETDWFYGNVIRLEKDFEGVYIDAASNDNFAALGVTRYVKVYYKYSDDTTWNLLGTLNSGRGGEATWPYSSAREGSERIKLGFMLTAVINGAGTPVVTAASLKYIPMVNDRYRWNLGIVVATEQADITGDEMYTDTYTQASTIAHLDACITSVIPISFTDVDGGAYNVKVVSHSRSIDRFEVDRSGNELVTYRYDLVIEEV